ncbi:hypothetical protein D7W79_12525 [Corallococcus exercitus]|nr:hypothetical protein D7W79_12525 [Corallococcus exercitus]
MGLIGLLCWFVPSVGVTLVLYCLGLFGLSQLTKYPFPGDPPVADLNTELALYGWPFILVGYCFFFVARKEPARIIQLWRNVLHPLTLLSFLAIAPSFALVAVRHWGEWSDLKAMLQVHEARVRALSSRADGTLSQDEFARAKAWFQEQPVTFRFALKSEPVKLRLMMTIPPYVGVDFRDGGAAVFDPVTMACISSD